MLDINYIPAEQAWYTVVSRPFLFYVKGQHRHADYMRMCSRMKTDRGAILPASHNSLLLGSLLSDADLLDVTVTKVLQPPLDILLQYAKLHFNGTNSVMSSVQNNALLCHTFLHSVDLKEAAM